MNLPRYVSEFFAVLSPSGTSHSQAELLKAELYKTAKNNIMYPFLFFQ